MLVPSLNDAPDFNNFEGTTHEVLATVAPESALTYLNVRLLLLVATVGSVVVLLPEVAANLPLVK